ncbi:metal ABC transporter substrate-binding protein [Oerskovia sp. NPDC056781]|uniref:metal ABC transporter substrate-binding protein n=1 Tax=Oerskovia sp. NPDC056781 TaxID=3345942 RepID=UPI00366D94FC
MPNFRLRTGVKPLLGGLVALLLATGCAVDLAQGEPGPEESLVGGASDAVGRLEVLTTFTVLADMAREVGGDHVEVASLTKVGAEIHGYEPTPADLRRAASADLVLDNGLGLEKWFEPFVARLDAPHVTVSEGVDVIEIGSGAYDGRPNPHAWMSPVNGAIYAHNIGEAFAAADPANAADYRANAADYAERIEAVGRELAAEVDQVPAGSRALVTCEGAFSYLARDVGLDERFLWPVNADQQGTPQQVARVIDYVRENEVRAVFCETTVSAAAQRQVAAETGATYAGTLYVDSLSRPDGAVPTYLDLLAHDARVIGAGLRGGS